MLEKEIIKSIYYYGYDISSYANKLQVVESDNSGYIENNTKQAIVTARTYSCTNILFYSDNFAYLVHMFPSETIGKNDKFLTRIEEVKKIILAKNPSKVNIIISLGESKDYEMKMNFHNLDYINNNLNSLVDFCNENKIELNMLPILRSKFLLFDLSNKTLLIENDNNKPFDVKKLESLSKELTKEGKNR